MEVLGIDIGGTGIKGGIVDTSTGSLLTDRFRLKTPQPATPDAMAKVFSRITQHFSWTGVIGCGMPAPIRHGKVMMATNIDETWVGVEASKVFADACGREVRVINDADAAGLAEIRFGAGKDVKGVVLVLTFGTGIGSALFIDGILVPNTELGHIEVRGKIAEKRAAARIRKEKNLSWKKWSKLVAEYLEKVELLFWPDLIIIGGGVSKKADRFLPQIKTRAEVVPAKWRNEAGIVGAALSAL